MLRNLKQMTNFKVLAKDNKHTIGKVRDIYFDEEKWETRYLVVDTGKWLSVNWILVSPYNIIDVDWEEDIIWVNLSKKQIEAAPKADLLKPTPNLYEVQYNNNYGFQNYSANGLGVEIDGIWVGSYNPEKLKFNQINHPELDEEKKRELHLRSMNDIFGYHIQAVGDDDFGSVTDFILEEDTWALRYIVIDTHQILAWRKKNSFFAFVGRKN